ncbi:uncharacterized protein B0P05DRAFT_533113 [Gilbertella persicaria]|uniref:uncharacterized protein n=1 Tax=Gilbertella persicaria TaxID=101096 RepID=UPI0022209B01|nr:uncharacterized protein B0P05DRAFT_533113 [Gilbertella persicaria]KAI8086968.1 hypothetical protein B0P05DRAFT_533113 [Gilbertella persicaria]
MSLFRKNDPSLRINTHYEHELPSPPRSSSSSSRVRQRLSNLFRSSSPVVSLKSPFSKRDSIAEQPTLAFYHPNPSTLSSASSASDTSDHMPASPSDYHEPVWEKQEIMQPLSLADQVHRILGSTLAEVDEEIDQDWEQSRAQLRQSLVLHNTTCERITLRF